MFLKELNIKRYGPLADRGRLKLHRYNLFWGFNERGKTLTIEALLKMLFQKQARYFKDIMRVNEVPEGYLIVEDEIRGEMKLPEAGTVSELYGFSNTEFNNIFVIRDSDLSIAAERDFYRSLTGRLTGMQTDEIKSICEKIYNLGEVTPGGDFQNIAPGKLKERLKKAEDLRKSIEILRAKLQEEGFGKIEKELAVQERKRSESEEILKCYSEVYYRELYEKGQEALKGLQKALTNIEALKQYNEEELNRWQGDEIQLSFLMGAEKNSKEQLAEYQDRLAEANKDYQKKDNNYRITLQQLKDAETILNPILSLYEQKHTGWKAINAFIDNTFIGRAALLAVIIFIITLGGAIYSPTWWINCLLILSVMFVTGYGFLKLVGAIMKSRLAGWEDKAAAGACKAGLDTENINDIYNILSQLRTCEVLEAKQLADAVQEKEWQQKEVERIIKERKEQQQQIYMVQQRLEYFRKITGVEEIAQYRQMIERKRSCCAELERRESILESLFGLPLNKEDKDVYYSFWKNKVEELHEYESVHPHLSYDQNTVTKLNSELEKTVSRIKIIKSRRINYLVELRDIEKDVNEYVFFDLEEHLPCQTIVDLEEIERRIMIWIKEKEDKRLAALTSLKIFKSLEQEEEGKISSLVGENSKVSGYFNNITKGLYEKVFFDSSTEQLTVVSSDGCQLGASQLSGGAYDQLYFSIRLSLGEKILESGKGFFILDDPFIKADYERLEKMFAMLDEIVSKGWQILYFSAKAEIKDLLQDKINRGEVCEFVL